MTEPGRAPTAAGASAGAATLTSAAVAMGRYLRRRVALVCALLVAAIAFVALSIHHHAERSAGSDARIEQVARLRFETAGLLMQLSGLVDPPTTESLASLAGAVEAWRLRRDGTTRDLTQLCEPDPRLCDGFDAIDAEAAAFDAAIGTVLGADREAASTAGWIATVLAIGSSFVSRYDDWIHALPGRISNHELQQMRVLLAGLAVTLISILLIAILIAAVYPQLRGFYLPTVYITITFFAVVSGIHYVFQVASLMKADANRRESAANDDP